MAANVQAIAGQVTSGVSAATGLLSASLIAVQALRGTNFDARAQGEKTFLFTYRGDDDVTLTSDVADYYLEDNTSRQDGIALKPEKITLAGYVGELTDQRSGAEGIAKKVAGQLTSLSPFVPGLTASALIAYNQAQQAVDAARAALDAGEQAFDLLTGQKYENRQQRAFTYFYEAWLNRLLFTVMTPWRVFTDMAISSLRAVQTEESSTVSEFVITFVKMRFAQTEYFIQTVADGRRAAQGSLVVSHGVVAGTDVGPINPAGTVLP